MIPAVNVEKPAHVPTLKGTSVVELLNKDRSCSSWCGVKLIRDDSADLLLRETTSLDSTETLLAAEVRLTTRLVAISRFFL